jgi:hypothetical protein
MIRANIHRRDALRLAYPPDAFAGDAAQNGGAPSELLRGVRILSAPDANGDFDFKLTTQQIGEAASKAFLAPHVAKIRPYRRIPIQERDTTC